ncbi:hypothetical protein [Halorussus sp. AFM4]|uniref:hypothetical protein n=1 Tax=Halorussus sp. AFM4 TaxID=3421651 RepID=UPI003EBCD736
MSGDEFRFGCGFCETTVRADTAAALKERGTTHLVTDHRSDLAAEFGPTVAGEPCREGCGYVFPDTLDEVAGVTCPDCGHDPVPNFARQYLYWQIERE